ETEEVAYASSYGRVLAKDIRAPVDVPNENTSHMDGYAVKSTDTLEASPSKAITLRLKGELSLGDPRRPSLTEGGVYKVPTGGIMPRGANAVVPVEEAEAKGGTVIIREPVESGRYVHARGEDIKEGQLLYRQGDEVRAQDLDVLGTAQVYNIEVFRRPRVSVLAVGSELRNEPEELRPGLILNTHSKVILAMAEAAGCDVSDLGVAPDDLDAIKEGISFGLETSDMVMTVGGSSVGEADLVSQAINSLGSPGVLVHGVKLDLGRVAGCGVLKGKPVVILPGLIGSTLNAFVAFCLPLIRGMAGYREGNYFGVEAVLSDDRVFREKYADFLKVVYVKLRRRNRGFVAEPLLGEAADVGMLIRADGFFIASEETLVVKEGEKVLINFLPGFSLPKSRLFPSLPYTG
ncbi:MAG: molybdopterin molybdotransferase MoeA, partial [Candidatus Geothermarchaeales archaeon]